jgi:hypothetical protein
MSQFLCDFYFGFLLYLIICREMLMKLITLDIYISKNRCLQFLQRNVKLCGKSGMDWITELVFSIQVSLSSFHWVA